MSMPSIPNMNPTISVVRDDAVNIILSSIGMEELSLAHLMNAEAEKIQFALGTLETANGKSQDFDRILETNRSAGKMLRDVIKNQMLLTMKMEDTISLTTQNTATEPVKEDPAPEEPVKEEAVKEESTAQPEAQASKTEPAPEPQPADEPAPADQA